MPLLRALCLALILLTSFPARAANNDNHTLLASGGAGGWLNVTRPLTADDMKGRLVLLDFWTYGCINCMQVVPDLEYLEQKFGDKLLIVGVHSAKFAGEQGNERILAAAKRFGLKHPVINDSDFAIWKSFGVRAWPTTLLLGPDGAEIDRWSGEGNRAEMEQAINKALSGVTMAAPIADLVAKSDQSGILSFPARLAYGNGMFFVADSGHNRIVGFDGGGTITMTIGSGAHGLKDGAASDAMFDNPRGVTFSNGILYVADTGNHTIRRIDLMTQDVTTIAGSGKIRDPLASPWDVEMTGDGYSLAIANAGTHQLFILDTKTGKLNTLAGTGRESIDDGKADDAALAQPSGLSRAGDDLFFVDAESSALRVLEKGRVKTLIGTGLFDFGQTDGAYPQAMMQHPQGLYADADRVIVADTYNNALRIYDRKTGILSTVALKDKLNEPGDVLMVDGVLYVVDTNAGEIRTVDPASGTIGTVSLTTGTPQ